MMLKTPIGNLLNDNAEHSQTTALFETMSETAKRLNEHESPDRQHVKYMYGRVEQPFSMPDFIQNYLDVGMRLDSVVVAVDATELGVDFAISVVCRAASTSVAFAIELNETGGYNVTRITESKEDTFACEPQAIHQMLTELSMSLTSRRMLENERELMGQPTIPDIKDPTIAHLIMSCLSQTADSIEVSKYFTLYDGLGNDMAEFTTSESAGHTTYTMSSASGRDDESSQKRVFYEVELDQIADPDSSDVIYKVKVDTERIIKGIDDDDFKSAKSPADVAVIEYAIGLLHALNNTRTMEPRIVVTTTEELVNIEQTDL